MTERKRILVVDDEPSVLLTCGAILSGRGYDVTTAGSAAQAMACIDRERFDLVFTDYSLEPQQDGLDVIAHARRRWPDIPVLLFTGYAADETAALARAQNVVTLFKPLDLKELFATIAGLIGEADDEEHEAQDASPQSAHGRSRSSTRKRKAASH